MHVIAPGSRVATPAAVHRFAWLLVAACSLGERPVAPAFPKLAAPPKARAPAPQTCDERKPADLTEPLPGRYTCRLARGGTWSPRYPCEVVPPGRSATFAYYVRATETAACAMFGGVSISINSVELDGAFGCQATPREDRGAYANVKAPLVPIGGGFRLDARVESGPTGAHEDIVFEMCGHPVQPPDGPHLR